MKDLLLLLIVGVLVLENVLASDVGVTVIRMDITEDLKTSGLFDLETSEDLKAMNHSISRAKLISSSMDDDLDAKVHNALNLADDVKTVDEVKPKAGRCRYECMPNSLKDTETEFLVFTTLGDDCHEFKNIPVDNSFVYIYNNYWTRDKHTERAVGFD